LTERGRLATLAVFEYAPFALFPVIAAAKGDGPLFCITRIVAFAVVSSLFFGCGPPSQRQDSEPAKSDNQPTDPAKPPAGPGGESTIDEVENPDEDRPTPIATIDELKTALKAKNPDFGGEIRVDPFGQLAGQDLLMLTFRDKKLNDISPLAGMRTRIGGLDLSQCGVTDISPLEGMRLMCLYMEENKVRDISVLKGMPLIELYLSNTEVEDISSLHGAPLKKLNLLGTRVSDLRPLSKSPIQMLWLNGCPVKDVTPLKTVPLVSLTLADTKVTDIRPLMGHPIQRLHIGGTDVTDLTPLNRMQLTRLIFTPHKIEKGIRAARQMRSLTEIGTSFESFLPPIQFWALFDAGQIK